MPESAAIALVRALEGPSTNDRVSLVTPTSGEGWRTAKSTGVGLLVVIAVSGIIATAAAPADLLNVRLDDRTVEHLTAAAEDKWIRKDMILGAVLAALAGILTGWVIHWLDVRKQRIAEMTFCNNVLHSIRRELSSLKDLYDNNIGKHLQETPPNDYLKTQFALTEEWTTIYRANAMHMGRLEPNVSGQIVITYACLLALIEQFRIHNCYLVALVPLLQQFDITNDIAAEKNTQGQPANSASDEVRKRELEARKLEMQAIENTKLLKYAEERLQSEVGRLFDLLDQRRIT